MYFVLFCLFMDVYYIYFCFDFYSDMYNALAICTYVRHANKAIWIELNWIDYSCWQTFIDNTGLILATFNIYFKTFS